MFFSTRVGSWFRAGVAALILITPPPRLLGRKAMAEARPFAAGGYGIGDGGLRRAAAHAATDLYPISDSNSGADGDALADLYSVSDGNAVSYAYTPADLYPISNANADTAADGNFGRNSE